MTADSFAQSTREFFNSRVLWAKESAVTVICEIGLILIVIIVVLKI